MFGKSRPLHGRARPAQRGALRFHFFLDERQSGDHHGVPQCCACQPAQRQHQLLLRALLSTSALAILVHGGFLLLLQPDLSIGRGLPPLQFQQLFGHCPLNDLPPLFIQVGNSETLLDDSTRLADKAKEAGVDATLQIWDEMPHVWHLAAPVLPEGQEAIDKIGEFVRQRTS